MDYAPLQAVFRVEGEENPIAAGIERFRSPCAEGQKARLKAEEALRLKQTEFSAQGVEMNQRYESAAVVGETEAEVWNRDRELYLQPTTRPGAKIPHAWLVNRKGHRISTLDVVGKGKFTIVTGLSGQVWAEAAAQLNETFLRTVVIGELDYQDPYCEWQRRREINESGVLVVRPDGVVAWRKHHAEELSIAQAKLQLEDILNQVLAR